MKSPGLALIIAKGMPKPGKGGKEEAVKPGEGDEADSTDVAKESAVEELWAAQKSGDAAAGVAAFKQLMGLCGYGKESESDEE